MNDDRDTLPPAPLPAEIPISDLPPSIVTDVARRLERFDDRLDDMFDRVDRVGRDSSEAIKLLYSVAGILSEVKEAAQKERAELTGAIKAIAARLHAFEANMEILQNDTRGIRMAQARQSEDIERLRETVQQLRRDDDSLRKRLDELAERLDAHTEAASKNGRQ